MMNQSKFETAVLLALPGVIVITLVAWAINTVKLTYCDFKAPYTCEAIHGAGLVPPITYLSVWYETDTLATKEIP